MTFADFKKNFNYMAVNFWMREAEMVGKKVK
jgi:hypothetical protein